MSFALIQDLKQVLGLSTIFNADSSVTKVIDLSLGDVGTVSFNKCDATQNNDSQRIVLGAGRVYSLDFYVSAAGSESRWSLIDASASSSAGTAFGSDIYNFRPMQAGAFGEDLLRPLVFTKGLVIAYTATAGNFSRQVYYGLV